MIIGSDTNPSNEIYYIGAILLSVIKSSSDKYLDILDVYQELNRKRKISMNLFVLALDWLFMIGTISIINGNIENVFKKS